MTHHYHDIARTRRATIDVLRACDLERITERVVRARVLEMLTSETNDDARALALAVDPDVVSSTIDWFLTNGDESRGKGSGEQNASSSSSSSSSKSKSKSKTKSKSTNEKASPRSAGTKKRARADDASSGEALATLAALRACGERGGDAKTIASYAKVSIAEANSILYAAAKRGEATTSVGDGRSAPTFVAVEAIARGGSPALNTTSVVKKAKVSESENEKVEDQVAELSSTKRVVVRKYKNVALVDVREYYQQPAGEGSWKPGKKGISLTKAQWDALASVLASVPEAMAEAERVPGKEVVVGELGSKRKCTVSVFKGKPLLNVREYYEKNGVMCPGAKGVALTKEAAMKLIDCADEVSARVAALG